ncbi:hypothetical protein [uncultured Brachyspira sp.]|uniref:hypothetical protein n=1 Tax=uncultured Brachyspira sp. TaxID=221953 RepID=UPI0025D33B41|nr:hypothetical protein [uncultured Brachyspira sp.]
MVNNHDKLSRQNLIILIIGLLLFALSFLFTAMIGQHPEGFLGFLAPFTMLAGIITIAAGFLYKSDS